MRIMRALIEVSLVLWPKRCQGSPPCGAGASLAAPIRAIAREGGLEHASIRQRRPALALHGYGTRAGGGRGGFPGIALSVIVDEEGGREDVAGTGGVDLPGPARPHLVALTIDEEQ